eukprot:44144-Prorocentrum_minimum.AAC.1
MAGEFWPDRGPRAPTSPEGGLEGPKVDQPSRPALCAAVATLLLEANLGYYAGALNEVRELKSLRALHKRYVIVTRGAPAGDKRYIIITRRTPAGDK